MSKSNIIVRPAETTDIPAIIEASLSVNPWKVKHNLPEAEPEKIGQPFDMEANIAMYQKWIDNKEWSTKAMRLFVAVVDGKILGYTLLAMDTPNYFAVTDLKQMYMANIIVHRDHGNQGIGNAMIEWIKLEAAKQNIEIIRAECSRGKLEEWYRKHGFISVPYRGNAPNYPTNIHTMLEMPKAAFQICG
jgi:GNAT superfamily N-acetyltransferase